MTIENVLTEYMDYNRALTPKTRQIYRININKFKEFTQTNKISNIRISDVFNFKKKLFEMEYRDATIANYLVSIRGFMRFASEMGYCNFPYVLIKPPRVKEVLKEFISKEEFELIDAYLDDHTYQNLKRRLIYRLLWDTGARISEILNINISEIDIQKRFVIIDRGKSFYKNVLTWSDETHELFVKYLGIRMCINESEPLFTSQRIQDKRLTARSIQRWCNEISNELGIIKNITPHSFRHGKGHEMLNKGAKAIEITHQLGHKTPSAVMTYVRQNPAEQLRLQSRFL